MPRWLHEPRKRTAAAMRVQETIDRYRRDVALLRGRLVPICVDIDDLLFLEFIGLSKNPQDVINDRLVRIKTLEATLDLLRE